MKKLIFTCLVFNCFLFGGFAQNVVITEIMYDNISTDNYEYVELYNNGNNTVNLGGWTFSSALTYIFPAVNLLPGDYLIVAKDSVLFEAAFGVAAFQLGIINSTLNNSGETIVLKNAAGVFVDSVAYSAASPWPAAASGDGSSLVLCDYDSDNNDPLNWAAAITPAGFMINNMPVLANPGGASACPLGPVISFLGNEITLLENSGTVFVPVTLSGGNANATQVTLSVNAASTASASSDHNIGTPIIVNFPAGVFLDTQIVTFNLVDDAIIEGIETLILDLGSPTNSGTVSPGAAQFTYNIIDNDAPLTSALLITGVFDTQVESGGTWAKGVELKALEDIPNLSIFGVGSANNGFGSSGVEVTLPAISLNAGECVYVTNDSVLFLQFFGFSPDISSGAASINGDDAIELFENAVLIDVFGDVTYPAGSTLVWNYLDGWAYRQNGSAPNGGIFNSGEWVYSGQNVFDNVPNNASAPNPFPVCSYSPDAPDHAIANDDNASTDIDATVQINVLANDILPNALTSMIVTSAPSNGTATVNSLTSITYTPSLGFCGTDEFTYEICDAGGCDAATVTVNVICPSSYPAYNIGDVTTVDASGAPDSLGVTVQLQGIVHGIDFQGGAPIQFALIDPTGGISVFSGNDFGYTVEEGDELVVRGTIVQFNCLTQITPDTLFVVSTGNPLVTPELTTFLNESHESELIRINNLTLATPSQWLGNGTSFNLDVTNGASTYVMRIDNDNELANMPAPTVPFHAIGLAGQFDNMGICDVGYQFFPRYAADLILLTGAGETQLNEKIQFYPNPVSEKLFIQSEVNIEVLTIVNLLGQQVTRLENPAAEVDLSTLQAGVYLVRFEANGSSRTAKLVKQ